MALLRLRRAAKKRAATAKIDHSFSNYHLIYEYGFWEWEKDNSDYGVCML